MDRGFDMMTKRQLIEFLKKCREPTFDCIYRVNKTCLQLASVSLILCRIHTFDMVYEYIMVT